MKLAYILFAASTVLAASNQLYDADGNVTCTSDVDSGDITCQIGHLDEASEIPSTLKTRHTASIAKRLSCGINISGVDGCMAHCYAEGYCNSYCDSKGTCRCRCKDKTKLWGHYVHLCSTTTCS